MSNRLAAERSPYLLQHADNPVDWYPWGDEAFARARAEDKPIFLSIGYSTCHWCHVMAHESFEDPAIAAVLNRDFVSIKLDREERPDVDRVYMTFVQATTGAGGWPMSVFLTPALEPFFGGTYFPPTSRWGRPGFVELLAQLANAWRADRPGVVASAKDVVEKLRAATGAGSAPDRAPVAGRGAIVEGIAAFAKAFDARHGGFGGAPKFPRPSELLFLLRAYALTGEYDARRIAIETLRAMAMGGMRDHVGGGFHRYSVDAEWRVPHFEKMLYDQAQLAIAYLEAAQVTGEEFYATVAEDTLEYVAHALLSPEGGCYSAEDADSVPVDHDESGVGAHGPATVEGAFYVWTAAEIDALFGDDAAVVRRRFGVEDGGNAPSDPQGEFRGKNILYVAQTIEEIAARTGRPIDDVMRVLGMARGVLFGARLRRPRPHLDDKIITAWNGLMIAAFARASRVVVDSPSRGRWLDAATHAASFVRDHMWRADQGALLRSYRAGAAGIDAFAEDYAFLAWGVLELFEATGCDEWLAWTIALVDAATTRFWDPQDGGWFATTGADPAVLLRLKEDYDGAEPSAASVMIMVLLRLAHLTGDASLRDRAGRGLERFGPGLGRVARIMPLMLANVAAWHAAPMQIVIAGRDAAALERVVAAKYLPFAEHIPIAGTPSPDLAARLPWLAALRPPDGRAAAFVCRDFACELPISDPVQLASVL